MSSLRTTKIARNTEYNAMNLRPNPGTTDAGRACTLISNSVFIHYFPDEADEVRFIAWLQDARPTIKRGADTPSTKLPMPVKLRFAKASRVGVFDPASQDVKVWKTIEARFMSAEDAQDVVDYFKDNQPKCWCYLPTAFMHCDDQKSMKVHCHIASEAPEPRLKPGWFHASDLEFHDDDQEEAGCCEFAVEPWGWVVGPRGDTADVNGIFH